MGNNFPPPNPAACPDTSLAGNPLLTWTCHWWICHKNNQTVHLPGIVNLIAFPPCFFMKSLTWSCRSTHLLPLALYHVIWRLPSLNLCWKSHHLTKIFWKTAAPFLIFHFSLKSLKKSFSTNFSLISKKKPSATPFSQPIEQDIDQRPFCYMLWRIFSPPWTITTFLFFFCWIFLQLLTLLTTKFFCPTWTLFLAFSLLHSNGFSHISQTDVSPLRSVTHLHQHHSSCTECASGLSTGACSLHPVHYTSLWYS